MLYRSPLTRWFLAAVGIIAGLVLTFGPAKKWHSAPSMHWLAQAPIPLQAWGVAVIVYGVLLLIPQSRPVAYAVGMVLFAVFTISLVATVETTGPKSVMGIAAMLDVTAFHAFAIRTALDAKLAP